MSYKKVLLINPPQKDQSIVRDMAGGFGFDGGNSIVLPPLDFAYMAATLIEKGYEAKILDSEASGYQNKDIHQIIKEYKPETIIATVSLPSLYKDCSFIKGLYEHTSALLIAKTSIAYPPVLKEILEKSSTVLCIYGECDTNIDKIIEREDTKGTAYFKDGELIIEGNNFIANLDELPLPKRNLLPNDKYHYGRLGHKITTIQTSRGCPFPCSYYCSYPLVQGKKWRARSPEHVIREIEDIVYNHQIKKILFRDATFTLDKSRAEEICDLIIRKNFKIDWWCETRADCLDEKLMQKMKLSGCKGINIGVETGDTEVRIKQGKIGLTLEKLIVVRNKAYELGLDLHFLLMVGLPDETKKSIYETNTLICDLKPKSIGVSIITPRPGTPLYAEAKKNAWIETEDWTMFDGHSSIMHTDHLSTQDLLKARKMILQGFYLSKIGLIGWSLSILMNYRFQMWAFHK